MAEEQIKDFIQSYGYVEDQQYKDYVTNVKNDTVIHIKKELLEDDDGAYLKMYLKRAKSLFKKYKEINQSNFKKDFEKNINEYYESNIN